MSDANTVLDQLQSDLEALDRLGKAIYKAGDELSAAEEAWEEKLDLVGESLREEYREKERKTDPADHTIVSVARVAHRAEYVRYRRAKRDLERLQMLSQVRRQLCSGRQSELSALRDELAPSQRVGQRLAA